MIDKNEKIKFNWEGRREPCPVDEIGKTYSTKVEKQYVINTISECLSKIKSDQNNKNRVF